MEGRGSQRGVVGIAHLDLKHPGLHLSQFDDGYTYTRLISKLHVLQPVEVCSTIKPVYIPSTWRIKLHLKKQTIVLCKAHRNRMKTLEENTPVRRSRVYDYDITKFYP